MMGGVDLQPQTIEDFITDLHRQYSSKFDQYGAPLMQKHELADFLEGFTGMPLDPAISDAVSNFDEKIAQQKEAASEKGLLPEEAEQGLYLDSFSELLLGIAQRLPAKMMTSIIAGRHYLCGGDAAILAQSMKKVGKSPTARPWFPTAS